jgi:hypothetical protein
MSSVPTHEALVLEKLIVASGGGNLYKYCENGQWKVYKHVKDHAARRNLGDVHTALSQSFKCLGTA